MFYKPKFCCNCGEKIERADWGLLTSRRFCSVCEIENKGNELLPRVVVGIAALFGIFGIGSYFTGGRADVGDTGPKTVAIPVSKRNFAVEQAPPNPGSYGLETAGNDALTNPAARSESPVIAASKEQPNIRKAASEEPVYFCGAMTKKGKPCSRRVKSNDRCWQHAGQPSAVSARKLPDTF